MKLAKNKIIIIVVLLISVCLTPIIFNYFPAPFAWLTMLFFLNAIFFTLFCKKTTNKSIWLNVAVLMITLFVCELYLYKTRDKSKEFDFEGDYTKGYFIDDELLGYAPKKDSSVESIKSYKGNLIYDVVYTIDKNGLRMAPPHKENAVVVLFFGDSFTFGEGLNDNETVPYLVGLKSEGKFHTYNFGFHGYGPHQMLAAIEFGLVDHIIEKKPSNIIYQFGSYHVARSVGMTSWDKHGPKFVQDKDGNVIYVGHFDDTQSKFFKNSYFQKLSDYMKKSMILRKTLYSYLNPDNYLNVKDKDIELFASIVERTKNLVKQKHPDCEFYTLFWDKDYKEGQALSKKIIEQFNKRKINLHIVSSILPNYKNSNIYSINSRDFHPNALANGMISQFIINEILDCYPKH